MVTDGRPESFLWTFSQSSASRAWFTFIHAAKAASVRKLLIFAGSGIMGAMGPRSACLLGTSAHSTRRRSASGRLRGGVDFGRQDTRISAVIPPRRILASLLVSILAASLCSEAGSADAPASRPAKAAQPAKRDGTPRFGMARAEALRGQQRGLRGRGLQPGRKAGYQRRRSVVSGARVQGAQAAPQASALREGLPDLERRARMGCEWRWLAGCRERFLHGAGDLLV